MTYGDVVMTKKPTRTNQGSRIQAGRVFEVMERCPGLLRGNRRVHLADKEVAFPTYCLSRSTLEVLEW